MRTVEINTKEPYKVHIGKGLLASSGKLISEVISPCKAAVIVDSTVDKLYSKEVIASLSENGFSCIKYVYEAGEESKNLTVYSKTLEFLADNTLTRSDIIVALGGGVCGDMAGFAAATYLRGIKFIQIPTTLLAAVDSSVGGKTAVNLDSGKNLVGAFHQPSLVICDTETLNTLPDEVLKDGIAETVKYGIITDEELFKKMEKNFLPEIEEIIERCVSIKNEIVKDDVFDHGRRQLLNLGHTFGHSIEKLSNFNISHGHAVAIGMMIVSEASEKLGLSEKGTTDRIKKALLKCGLPVSTDYSAKEIVEISLKDKKRKGDTITIVIPEKTGKSVLRKLKTDELYDFVEKGLN